MDEMKVLLQAILENVQMLNAKVERIEKRLDAVEHQLSEFREETKLSFTRTERHYRSLERDLDTTIHRVERLEEHNNIR